MTTLDAPHADYYDRTQNLQNCTTTSTNLTSCRYIRKTGDTCEDLIVTTVFSDAQFQTRGAPSGTQPTVDSTELIYTNCPNIAGATYLYGQTSSVVVYNQFALTLAIIIVLACAYWIAQWFRFMRPLYSKKAGNDV